MQWRTKVMFIDRATGEVLSKKHIDNKIYIIIDTKIKNIPNSKYYGTREITNLCERSRQIELFEQN